MSSAARNDALLAWYAVSPRSYPWRATTDPYRILVSEVMCQQTQAPRVVPRYEQFLQRFPDEAELAGAAPADVLEEWSGLGYNRRALNLQRAAAHVAEHGWPKTSADLQRLPGVGPYTAAAVACFAFGEPVAAVDTNLRRVLSRWAGAPLNGSALAAAAQSAIEPTRAADWNQALMDLGATLCLPRRPACEECPVQQWCADPDAYVPPRQQGRFEGSNRQARGAVVRALVEGRAMAMVDLAGVVSMDLDRVATAVESLVRDGVVVEVDGVMRLPTGRGANAGTIDGVE